MKNWIRENYKNLCVCLIVALILKSISTLVNSNFLDNFLQQNLILLLPALLAINVTTISIILSKISDFEKKLLV
jgi:hypothetical protein